jgi:hypothetical protein
MVQSPKKLMQTWGNMLEKKRSSRAADRDIIIVKIPESLLISQRSAIACDSGAGWSFKVFVNTEQKV